MRTYAYVHRSSRVPRDAKRSNGQDSARKQKAIYSQRYARLGGAEKHRRSASRYFVGSEKKKFRRIGRDAGASRSYACSAQSMNENQNRRRVGVSACRGVSARTRTRCGACARERGRTRERCRFAGTRSAATRRPERGRRKFLIFIEQRTPPPATRTNIVHAVVFLWFAE